MKALAKRVARLERAESSGPRIALLIIHGDGFDEDSLTGVDGIATPRRDGEAAKDYIARLEADLRATRGRVLPFVGFARYGDDDTPDAPSVLPAPSASAQLS